MTHDEIAKQITADVDKLDDRIADTKETLSALKKAREAKIEELLNLSRGGGRQGELFDEGNDL
jgi:hypothetical protein